MRISFSLAFILLFAMAPGARGQEACPSLDAADESHHSVIFRNSAVRVLELQLSRLQGAEAHCHTYTYLVVVTSEGRTNDGAIGTDWAPGDARLIYGPIKSTIRNEESMTFRAIEVESLRTQTYTWSARGQYSDPFGADQGTIKPTWSTTFSRAGLAGTKAQLAPGDSLDVAQPEHLLIAITAVELEAKGSTTETISLERGETRMLPGGSVSKLTNKGSALAKFVIVEL